jgi:NosR/NirI family nitrous oxide reductase transcriptional regulator
MGTAERMAEVEPFKSTFLVGGVWHRTWPFMAYWGALLLLSAFIERPFCKYLCPLGAGMAIPGSFRMIGLKRKAECTTCHACQKGCGSLAIDDQGRIDKRECLLCLECQVLYYDDHSCPPLTKERRRRQRGNLPLTAIGANGYYIPIKEEKFVPPSSPPDSQAP